MWTKDRQTNNSSFPNQRRQFREEEVGAVSGVGFVFDSGTKSVTKLSADIERRTRLETRWEGFKSTTDLNFFLIQIDLLHYFRTRGLVWLGVEVIFGFQCCRVYRAGNFLVCILHHPGDRLGFVAISYHTYLVLFLFCLPSAFPSLSPDASFFALKVSDGIKEDSRSPTEAGASEASRSRGRVVASLIAGAIHNIPTQRIMYFCKKE